MRACGGRGGGGAYRRAGSAGFADIRHFDEPNPFGGRHRSGGQNHKFRAGHLACVYYGNKLLVKRFIASAGQRVDIDSEGNVYVDDELLGEDYLIDKSLGECDITLPYQVPEGRIFVLGDHGSVSVDSRSTTVGCIADKDIIGEIVFRIRSLSEIGTVN